MIGAVSNSEWGWPKMTLKKTYQMYIKSRMDYGGPGWQPWLSETNMNALEVIQNRALRMITGQVKTTPIEAWRMESGQIATPPRLGEASQIY